MPTKLSMMKEALFGKSALPDDYDEYFNIIMNKTSSSEKLKEVTDRLIKDIRKYKSQLSNANTLYSHAKLKHAEALLEER